MSIFLQARGFCIFFFFLIIRDVTDAIAYILHDNTALPLLIENEMRASSCVASARLSNFKPAVPRSALGIEPRNRESRDASVAGKNPLLSPVLEARFRQNNGLVN